MNLKWNKNSESDVDLDRELISPAQMQMARLVKDLPEEMPSLAWRSDLNEQLRFQASKIRRKKMLTNWVLRPALGFGLASVFAVMMLTTAAPKPAAKTDRSAEVADAIVRTYHDELQNREVTYTSFTPEQAQPASQTDGTGDPYAEEVIDSI